jgi:hypothetical protein
MVVHERAYFTLKLKPSESDRTVAALSNDSLRGVAQPRVAYGFLVIDLKKMQVQSLTNKCSSIVVLQ